MPPYDRHSNLAVTTVSVAPSPTTSGTTLTVADVTNFPDPTPSGYSNSYKCLIWPAATTPTKDNAELVKVTGVSGSVLTIARAQEGTTARTVLVGDQIAIVLTAAELAAIEGTASEVATTDATVTVVATVPIPTNTTVTIEATIVGRRTGGASGTTGDSVGSKVTVTAKDVAGTVTIVGSAVITTVKDNAACAVTAPVSTTNIAIKVAGDAANNYSWYCIYRTWTIPS